MEDFLACLYRTRDDIRETFGSNWCGPDTLTHAERALVARYECRPDSDGQSVDVYCTAYPAKFYTAEVRSGRNSVGKEQSAYVVSTGSGQAELIAAIAEAIREGMLGFNPGNGEGQS